jgi:Tol biopolymer transport system component
MNDDGSQQAQLSPGGEANDFSPTWSQQGDVIFYSQILKGSKVPGLVGVRYEDRKNPREFRIPASPGVDIGPAAGINVSPDGYWFVYESWPDGTNHDVYLMSINGINIKRLTTDSGLEFGPVWRPVPIPSP